MESKNRKMFVESNQKIFLEDFRKVWPEFKHMRIRNVIQAYPSQIPINKVIYRD